MDQPAPHTAASLRSNLRALGVAPGDAILLHSSMKSLGFVAGGAQAVVQALVDTVGPDGTIVVPTHTSDNCDPSGWHNPPVPQSWWATIRDEAPGFDPDRTQSQWMGVLAETVRVWPGALRSGHPRLSMAALGAKAAEITGEHALDDSLGERSPLGAVYRLDGKVLLLGCGYDSNTSLHLAEWRQKAPPRGEHGASIRQPDGTGRWVTWTDVVEREDDFEQIGKDFEATGGATIGQVGNATSRLMSQRALVDFATEWIAEHRVVDAATSGEPGQPRVSS
jgi:aminoglycoside 3-N-acetyltransferase